MATPPTSTGDNVKTSARVIIETAEEAENLLHRALQSGSIDFVDYMIAIGHLLPLLSSIKMEADEIKDICEKDQIRNRKRRST